MPDLDFFDPIAYFDQKTHELEEAWTGKKARLELLQANLERLESTLDLLERLPSEHQKALQMEISALMEARETTQRNITNLEAEMASLQAKLAALRAARLLLGPEMDRPILPAAGEAGQEVRKGSG